MKRLFASALIALALSATAASGVNASDQSAESDAQRVRIALGVKGGYEYLVSRATPKNPYLSTVTYDYLLLYGDQLFDGSPAGQAAETEAESAVLARISEQAGATNPAANVYAVSAATNVRSQPEIGDALSSPVN
jgi:hypothetical protein